ncbi:hypothetical protein PGIGA_G00066410 [Pangasianodon gigas]|uniref:Uncharacterized protein n=1 Tax=Pangasianodon gigas TaxID=30993 RepID=A0ACC5X5X7_PANGG|nr:hypothetical protein [Pangasianodon gigas]
MLIYCVYTVDILGVFYTAEVLFSALDVLLDVRCQHSRGMKQYTKDKQSAASSCLNGHTCGFTVYQGRRYCVHCLAKKKNSKAIFKCRSCDVPLCVIADHLCFTK